MTQVLTQFQQVITIISLVFGLLIFNPWLIVILILAILPAFFGENYFNEKSYALTSRWTPQRRELDYLRYTGASDETAKEIKVFGLSGFLTSRFKTLSDEYFEENKKVSVKRAYWGGILSTAGTLAYYSAYIFILFEAIKGRISIGDLTFLSSSFLRLRTLLESFLTQLASITERALYLQDFFEFFELQPSIQSKGTYRPFPNKVERGYTFENVGFKYQNSEKWALRNISFHLTVGEKLALVGENGAGKSTLVKLLVRLYEPSEGRILLDGIDLREYNPKDIQKNAGLIFQDFVKYNFVAAENIAVGKIDFRLDQPKIEKAAVDSLAAAVIDELPNQYDQMIGRRFEGGVDLSGGQWQKIALARAYIRDSPLIVLDEPTAALDARAEHEVFQRFVDLSKNKTTVIISHRFSTVRMADRILVLEGGTLSEIGSHEELMDTKGKYAELFSLQAKGYATAE